MSEIEENSHYQRDLRNVIVTLIGLEDEEEELMKIYHEIAKESSLATTVL